MHFMYMHMHTYTNEKTTVTSKLLKFQLLFHEIQQRIFSPKIRKDRFVDSFSQNVFVFSLLKKTSVWKQFISSEHTHHFTML